MANQSACIPRYHRSDPCLSSREVLSCCSIPHPKSSCNRQFPPVSPMSGRMAVLELSPSGSIGMGERSCWGPLRKLRSSRRAKNPKVALTIDDNNFPHKVLLVRGTARLQSVNGVVPEYATAAERYFGAEQGKAWVAQLASMIQEMVRITVTPEWAG